MCEVLYLFRATLGMAVHEYMLTIQQFDSMRLGMRLQNEQQAI